MNRNKKKIKLTQIYQEWSSGKGIFSDMAKQYPNLPWASHVDASTLDLEYFGNKSGNKEISPLLSKMVTSEGLSEEQRAAIAKLVVLKNILNWTGKWNTMFFDYNPIENYNKTETQTIETAGSIGDVVQYGKSNNFSKSGKIINKDGDNSYEEFTKVGKTTTRDVDGSNDTFTKTGEITDTETLNTQNTKTGNESKGYTGIKQVTTTNQNNGMNSQSDTDFVKGFGSGNQAEEDLIRESINGEIEFKEYLGQTKWVGENKKIIKGSTYDNEETVEQTEYFKDSLGNNYSEVNNYDIIEGQTGLNTSSQSFNNYSETTNYNKEQEEIYGTESDPYKEKTSYKKEQIEEYQNYTETNSESGSDTNTKTTNMKETLTNNTTGNIGVMSTQQMINMEREVWDWSYFEEVFKDIDKILTSGLYVEDEFECDCLESIELKIPIATEKKVGGIRAKSKTNETAQIAIDEEGFLWYIPGQGENAVKSVNGQTGEVVLSIYDLGGVSLTSFELLQQTVINIQENISNIESDISTLQTEYTNINEKVDVNVNSINEIKQKYVKSVNGMTGDVTIDITESPVKSVNGEIGEVVLTATDVNALPDDTQYVQTVNGMSGNVTIDIPEVPVQSVNNKTGNVNLTASDVNALPAGTQYVKTVNGKSGNVTIDIPESPVKSVNGETGEVNLTATDVNALPADTQYVQSVNGKSGSVTIDIPEVPVQSVNTKTGNVTLTATDVNALPADTEYVQSVNGKSGNVTIDIPEVPVQSVNNQTGNVNLTASDVNALPADTQIPKIEAGGIHFRGSVTLDYNNNQKNYTTVQIPAVYDSIVKFMMEGDNGEYFETDRITLNAKGEQEVRLPGRPAPMSCETSYLKIENHQLAGTDSLGSSYSNRNLRLERPKNKACYSSEINFFSPDSNNKIMNIEFGFRVYDSTLAESTVIQFVIEPPQILTVGQNNGTVLKISYVDPVFLTDEGQPIVDRNVILNYEVINNALQENNNGIKRNSRRFILEENKEFLGVEYLSFNFQQDINNMYICSIHSNLY